MAEKGFEIITNGDPIKGAQEGIDRTINETLAKIATQAKTLAPTDKGQLRNSIMYKGPNGEGGFNDKPGEKAKDKLTLKATTGVGYVGSNLFYAPYQEFGTKNTQPQPFLRPAAAVNLGMDKEFVKKAMNEEVKKWTEDKTKRSKK